MTTYDMFPPFTCNPMPYPALTADTENLLAATLVIADLDAGFVRSAFIL